MYILLAFLFLSVLFEGTITTLPLTLITLLVIAVMSRDTSVFPFAFIAGLLLDVLLLRPLGATGVFFILYFLLVFLYQRKYEITTVPFVLFASFFGTVVYTKFFGVDHSFVGAVMSMIFAVLLFRVTVKLLGKQLFA